MATPYEVVDRTKADLVARLLEIIVEEGIAEIVVGLPISLDGRDGPAADWARGEAEALAGLLPIPVALHDERFSTVSAHRSLMDMRMKADARRRVVDQVAAAVMLDSWLAVRREGPR